MSPGNYVLAARPSNIYLHRNKLLRTSLADCRTLLRESTLALMWCKELVMGWPDVAGTMNASGEGVGGVIVGENAECVPTVYQMECPEDVKRELKTKKESRRKAIHLGLRDGRLSVSVPRYGG